MNGVNMQYIDELLSEGIAIMLDVELSDLDNFGFIFDIQNKIRKEFLYMPSEPKYGFEKNPHLTLIASIPDNVPYHRIARALTNRIEQNITVTLGDVSRFEQGEYDVLHIKVDAPMLKPAHNDLKKILHSTTKYEFNPHITIAYIKPGSHKELDGRYSFYGRRLTFNTVTIGMNRNDRRYLRVS